MRLWLAAVLAIAPTTTTTESLSHCDTVALSGPRVEREYGCYAKVARDGESEAVLAHLAGQVKRHPQDGQLWLTYGALLGDYGRDSTAALKRAVAALGVQELPQYQIQAQLNLARRYSNGGDADSAGRMLTEARSTADALGHPLLSAIVEFDTLGEAAKRLDGDLLTALERARQSYAALPTDAPYAVRRNGLQLMARAARALGRTRTAARLAEKAAQIAQDAGDTHSALHGWRMVARNRLHVGLVGNDPDAVPRFRARLLELLEQALEHDNPLAVLSIRLDLARIANASTQPERWTACRDLALQLDAQGAATSCRGGLAESIARREPERATTIANDLVATARTSGSLHTLTEVLGVQGRVAATQGDLEAAWTAWSEMFDTFEQLTRSPDAAELRGLLQANGSDRYRKVAGALLAHDPDDAGTVGRAFEAMERMRGREALEFRWRSGAGDGTPATTIGLDALIGQVPVDTALLLFQIGRDRGVGGRFDGGSWVIVVTNTGAKVHRLADAVRLDPAIAMVADSLAGPPSESTTQASASLYAQLFEAPLAALDPSVRHVVVIPDGQLHRLPTAALLRDDAPLSSFVALSTAPSATVWAQARSDATLPRRFVALADPAPPAPQEHDRFGMRSPQGRLPGALAEARVAAAFVGGDRQLFVGSDATESILNGTVPNGVLHIAAHTVVDPANPRASRILLAGDASEDGHVYMDELSLLDQSGSLVVLAACQGADGELVGGEGTLSPARALFLAGARTVVAGLWPVDDHETAAFFAEFYAALDDGLPVDAAVAHAQQQRREAGAPTSSWAGFVVIGDGSLTLAPRRGPERWHWVAIAAVLGGLLGGFVVPAVRRRSRRDR